MKIFSLALFLLLHPSEASPTQTSDPTPSAPRQEQQATPQSANLDEADKLNAAVVKLYAERKYNEALPLAQRALALREQFLKDDDPLVGITLHNLVTLYIALGDAGQAEPLCERILARRERGAAPTSAATMRVLAAYACIQSAKGGNKHNPALNLAGRISNVLLQDSIHAAGLIPPENLDELGGKRLKFVPPRYPGEAKSQQLQGSVFIMVNIDEKGKVVSAEPLPCGRGIKPLADAAAEAARSSAFTPTLVAGKPISRKLLVTYNFVLR